MTDPEDLDELVFLFEHDLSTIASELRYTEFESVLNHSASLAQFAASYVRAAYVVVGAGLSVRAIVFFKIRIDENGLADAAFNVPLRYLAKQSGRGPDLGSGLRIQMACRSHCPVPWHSINLWEPEGVGDVHPAMRLQKAVWRNRLGLKPQATSIAALLRSGDPEQTQQAYEAKLDSTLDDNGSIDLQSLIGSHNDQLERVAAQFRRELAVQQQAHRDQLRESRAEISKLRAALRSEKSRARRLQGLLRGEV